MPNVMENKHMYGLIDGNEYNDNMCGYENTNEVEENDSNTYTAIPSGLNNTASQIPDTAPSINDNTAGENNLNGGTKMETTKTMTLTTTIIV